MLLPYLEQYMASWVCWACHYCNWTCSWKL